MNNLHDDRNDLQAFFFGVNRQGVDKRWNYENLTTGFEDIIGSLDDLKGAITSGYAINGAHFNGDRRKAVNVKKVGLLMLDIDKGFSLEEAKKNPFIQQYCALGYTTASHTDQDHRFRLIFPLLRPLDRDNFEALVKVLSDKLPNDPSCKDAGRVFYGNTKAQFFIDNPEAVLPDDWINKAITQAEADRKKKELERRKRWEWRQKNKVFTTDAIPLLTCCSKEVRQLVRNGTAAGAGHNDAGLKVLAELIGVENYLREINQPASDTARENYDDFLRNSGVGDHKSERRWNWAEGRDYLPSLSPDKIDICIKAWQYRQLPPKEQKQFKAKFKFNPPSPNDDPSPTYEEKVRDLTSRNLTQPKLTVQIQKIAREEKVPTNEVRKLYDAYQSEADSDGARSDVSKELRNLLNTQSEDLDLSFILPAPLASAITRMAGWLNLRPGCYLTALLCGASSVISPKTKLTLSRATNHRVNAGLYGGVVANSSQKKTPIISEMITKPLIALQKRDEEIYQTKLTEYKAQQARYKQLEKQKELDTLTAEFPNGEPEPPTQTARFYTDVTGEKFKAQIAVQPDQGIMKLSDELAAVFKNANAYRNGKGSDIEDLLSLYDGQGFVVGRKSDGNIFIEQTNVGLFGGIQPKVLEQLYGDGLDSNGNWARFIFCQQPLAASTPPEHDEGGVNLEEMMSSLYQQIADTTAKTFFLSKDAYQVFRTQAAYFDQERIKLGDLPLSNQYGKAAGRIGKIALTLHHIKAAFEGVEPTNEVSAETVAIAAHLTAFYINQVSSLYAAMDEDQLAPHLMKIIDLAKRRNEPLTPRLVAKFIRGINSDQARKYFAELSALGYGTIQQEKTLKFTLLDPSADKCRQNNPSADKVPTIVGTLEPSNNKGFKLSADSADTFFDSYENFSTQENSPPSTGSDLGKKNIYIKDLSALSALPPEPLHSKCLEPPTAVGTCRHLTQNVGTSLNPIDKSVEEPLPGDREALMRINDEQIKHLGINESIANKFLENLHPGKNSRENLNFTELQEFVGVCQQWIKTQGKAPLSALDLDVGT